jgi:hypothetical protein
MSFYEVRNVMRIGVVLCALVGSALESPSVSAGEAKDESRGPKEKVYKSKIIYGIAATGLNDVLGRAPFDLGEPFGAFRFSMMGLHNPSGPDPYPLNPHANASDLLVTIADPNFLLIAGKTRADVSPGWENIPLRDVPINVDFGSVTTAGNGIKRPLRGVLHAEPIEVAQAEPSYPITVGRWLKGRGVLKIVCHTKVTSTLEMTVRNLLPNRIYGIGATMGGLHSEPMDQKRLAPFTIGGVPHLLVTDQHGDGVLKREVNFCPLDPESTERPLLVMNLLHYSRHQNYGAVPEPVFVNGLWLGMVTHNHLQFPVNVQPNPEF